MHEAKQNLWGYPYEIHVGQSKFLPSVKECPPHQVGLVFGSSEQGNYITNREHFIAINYNSDRYKIEQQYFQS